MVALSTFLSTLLLLSSAVALPASTTIDLTSRDNVPVRRQAPAPSMARRGLHRKKHVDVTYIPGNKKDYSPFLCPSPEAPVVPASTSTALPLNPNNVPVLTKMKSCPAPGAGLVGDALEGLSPEELGAQMETLADWFRVGFECVDFENDTENCGGCAIFNLGYVDDHGVSIDHMTSDSPLPLHSPSATNSQNCTAIPSARRTTCSQATCHVLACEPGYVISKDKTSCVERSRNPALESSDEDWAEQERLLEESDKQKVIGRKR
jgi:hypothetical protein